MLVGWRGDLSFWGIGLMGIRDWMVLISRGRGGIINSSARLEGLAAEGADAERLAVYQKFWWRWVDSGVDLNS